MTIGCILHSPEDTPMCRALQFWDIPPVPSDTLRDLEQHYCATGRFITCPLFRFVQERLDAMNRAEPSGPWSESPRVAPPAPSD